MTEENQGALRAYCFKCKTKRDMLNAEAIYNRAGVPATRGKCLECGTTMYRSGRTDAHANLPKPEKVERPARKKKKSKRKTKPKSKARSGSNGRRANVGKLVIVESPAKARSIGGFLGEGFTVMSSLGHVRDLLKSRLSVDVEENFEPEYRVPNDKRAVVKELKLAADGAEEIFLATDPDREGEAIAWHLVAAAEMPEADVRRVVFHEITDSAVAEAFAQPRQINMDLVNAQQARRILDRLVGYQVSQLLWSKVRGGLSAGRVQSIALRLVVEREKEIAGFAPVEYWTIDAELAKRTDSGAEESFTARLTRIDGESVHYDPQGDKPPVLADETTVQPHMETLSRSIFEVSGVKRGTRQSRPLAPFTTSTLQQAASNRYGYRAGRTMQLAQQLYEGIDIEQGKTTGLITYMRTDSVQVSKDAQSEARKYILERHGKAYAPKSPPMYRTKSKSAQEAHEAIRPTSVWRSPDSVKGYLNAQQLRLYSLIWRRFVASQMSPAIYDTHRIEVKAGLTPENMPYLFRASGQKLKFPGHLAVSDKAPTGDAGGKDFPEVAAKESLDAKEIRPEQHHTQPPPRYTEATLIKDLEERGIGRPSTYAPTVGVIQARDYVTQEDRRLIPTKTGEVVCELLSEFFDVEMDYAFTARMESQLDDVSSGKLDWRPMLDDFYHPFEQRLVNARENMPRRAIVEKIGRVCPKCEEGDLIVKHSRYGKFIGCSNYPECKHTERYLERKGLLCPQCGEESGGEIVAKRSRKGRPFYGCSRYPDCDYAAWRLPRNLKKVDANANEAAEQEPSVV